MEIICAYFVTTVRCGGRPAASTFVVAERGTSGRSTAAAVSTCVTSRFIFICPFEEIALRLSRIRTFPKFPPRVGTILRDKKNRILMTLTLLLSAIARSGRRTCVAWWSGMRRDIHGFEEMTAVIVSAAPISSATTHLSLKGTDTTVTVHHRRRVPGYSTS